MFKNYCHLNDCWFLPDTWNFCVNNITEVCNLVWRINCRSYFYRSSFFYALFYNTDWTPVGNPVLRICLNYFNRISLVKFSHFKYRSSLFRNGFNFSLNVYPCRCSFNVYLETWNRTYVGNRVLYHVLDNSLCRECSNFDNKVSTINPRYITCRCVNINFIFVCWTDSFILFKFLNNSVQEK